MSWLIPPSFDAPGKNNHPSVTPWWAKLLVLLMIVIVVRSLFI